jgi:hypothetical protein
VFPYWLLFAVYAFGAIQSRPSLNGPFQGGPFFLSAGVFTILMIGLRYDVGGDWPRYVELLESARYVKLSETLFTQDPGYSLINWLVAKTGSGVWAVNLICAALFMWGVVRFARRQPNPWLVVVVAVPYLIIAVAMGYTRQAVAIGILLAGLSVLPRGVGRFVIYLAAAVSFHKSALAVLPLVALSSPRRPIITALIFAGSAVLLYYLFVEASVDKLMNNYVESGYASQGAGIRVAMNIPPAALYLLFRRRFMFGPVEQRLWRNFAVAAIGAGIVLAFTTSTTAVDRLALYLIPLQMAVLGRLPDAFPQGGRTDLKMTLLVVLYSALIQFVWLNYAENVDAWLPYRAYVFDRNIE